MYPEYYPDYVYDVPMYNDPYCYMGYYDAYTGVCYGRRKL